MAAGAWNATSHLRELPRQVRRARRAVRQRLAWLIDKDGKLTVVATGNADTPMAHGVRCLLTLRTSGEHATSRYQQPARYATVQAVLEKRLNWDFAEKNLC